MLEGVRERGIGILEAGRKGLVMLRVIGREVVEEGRLMVEEEGRGLVGIDRLSREEAIEVVDLIVVVVGIDSLTASTIEMNVVVADLAIVMIDEVAVVVVDASAIATKEVVVIDGAGLMIEEGVDRGIGTSRDINLVSKQSMKLS